MGVQICNRLMTKVGAALMRNARILAYAAHKAGVPVRHQIFNGFLLRATGKGKVYIATVMDFPSYVLFPGPHRGAIAQVNLAVPVGTRDDFVRPGTESAREVENKQSYLLLPDIHLSSPGELMYVYWGPQVALDQKLLGISALSAPLKAIPPDSDLWYLDDTDYFDYSSVCTLTAMITSVLYGARSLNVGEDGSQTIGAQPLSYFSRNLMTIDERNLPDDWKLYLRRIVPLSQSAAGMNQRRYPGDTMPGLAIDIARDGTAAVGIDRYCIAAQMFRQNQTVWGPVGGQSYDRNGERALMIAVGATDRSQYSADAGSIVNAVLEPLLIVTPNDIEQDYLHPVPAILPGTGGAPDLTNYGTFYTPKPERAGSERGFVVFSNYDTSRNLGDSGTGRLSSILTTLLDGSTVSLKADWDTAIGEPVPTGTPGQFTRPWIVGTASIPTVDQGETRWTAYCLVWESNYAFDLALSIGGNWALYKSDGESVTRTAMDGGAPLFAAIMRDSRIPLSSAGFDNTSPFSAVFWMGGTKLVTAATQFPLPDNEFGEGRQITSAILDVATGAVTLGGVIAETTSATTKCWITVVQPELPAVGDAAAIPAVLLATVTQHLVRWPAAEGKTYLSVDGGANWSEYITDAAGPAGAFFVGNKLWAPDCTERFDQKVFG